MPGRNFVFVPGPTNVPDRLLRAMAAPMDDHRSCAFPELTFEVLGGLKKVFKTQAGEVFIFPCSGTGAWEAALANTLSPGDKVLAVRLGHFSQLCAALASRIGLDVEVLDEDWGHCASAERIELALRADRRHAVKGVLVVHNETATGVTSDIAAIRRAIDAARHPALLYVDAISSIGCIDFPMDDWRVDVAVGASQKGFMLPPGIGIVALSRKALDASKRARCRRAFFDIGDMIDANAAGYFPYTPPLSLLYGLRESLRMIFEETLEAIFARHRFLAQGVRASAAAWGFPLCAAEPDRRSETVSVVRLPPGCNARQVIEIAFRRYRLALGAGHSHLAERVFRIGHLGDLNELMVLGALGGVEMALRDADVEIEFGSGVAAAERHFRDARAGTGRMRLEINGTSDRAGPARRPSLHRAGDGIERAPAAACGRSNGAHDAEPQRLAQRAPA